MFQEQVDHNLPYKGPKKTAFLSSSCQSCHVFVCLQTRIISIIRMFPVMKNPVAKGKQIRVNRPVLKQEDELFSRQVWA